MKKKKKVLCCAHVSLINIHLLIPDSSSNSLHNWERFNDPYLWCSGRTETSFNCITHKTLKLVKSQSQDLVKDGTNIWDLNTWTGLSSLPFLRASPNLEEVFGGWHRHQAKTRKYKPMSSCRRPLWWCDGKTDKQGDLTRTWNLTAQQLLPIDNNGAIKTHGVHQHHHLGRIK